ncbi:MAG: sigma-70 family RNA polymerase sigma factor [Candidatus Zixiibacteriota bacterium]
MYKSDSELWSEIVNGSSKAWEVLVKRYQALVYTVAMRMGLSQADAADCFQQTWSLLFQYSSKLRDPSRLSAWLVTTAKREALRLKRRVSENYMQISHSDNSQEDRISPSGVEFASQNPLPDKELEILERQAQLEIALKEIGGRCQELLETIFFSPEDKSYREIAQSLGMAYNSIGPLRQRCLEKLKKILEKNCWIEELNDD